MELYGNIPVGEIVTTKKTGKIAFQCLQCDKISIYRASRGDGNACAHCGGHIVPIGYAKDGVMHCDVPLPTESAEQQALFQWAQWAGCKYPGIDLMYHIPNGGARSKGEAGRFKAEGVKAGVPDICLPVARGRFHGLYIEMKRIGGKVSKYQQDMIDRLNQQGYCAVVCYGFDEAREVIEKYYDVEGN